jgi:hypothetical protein
MYNSAMVRDTILAARQTRSGVLCIDPVARTATTFGNVGEGQRKWLHGVLGADNKIYGIPCQSSGVLCIDPVARTVTTFGNFGEGGWKWLHGVLGADNKMYGIPCNSSGILQVVVGASCNFFESYSAWAIALEQLRDVTALATILRCVGDANPLGDQEQLRQELRDRFEASDVLASRTLRQAIEACACKRLADLLPLRCPRDREARASRMVASCFDVAR